MRKAAPLNWITYRWVSHNRQRAIAPRWRVGIYKVDRLGDFVLSIGAIRAIAEAAGEQNCVLFHSAVAGEIARREFPQMAQVELPPLDGKLWITRRRLRSARVRRMIAGGVDELLCLRHFRTLFDEVALQMIPAKKVWCIQNSRILALDYEIVRRRFGGDVVIARPNSSDNEETCEDLRCHQSLLGAWAGNPHENRDLRPRIAVFGATRFKTMALAPFGSHRLRDLPIEGAAECVKYARETWGLESVLLSPPGAVSQYEAYARELRLRGADAIVRVTPTSNDLIDTLAASSAVLTTETATAHIAAALDLPTVCVLGGGHYGLFAPWHRSARQVWLTHRVPCFHCNWRCFQPQPYCITRVTADQMVEALGRVLGTPSAIPFSVGT